MLADANFILRILLNDNKSQSNYATEIINNNSVQITNEVLAEIVYVLEKVYNISKTKISDILIDLLKSNSINSNVTQILALSIYKSENLDFVDCILLSYNYHYKEKILFFDKKLQKKLI